MLVILKKGRQLQTVENVFLEDAHKPAVKGENLMSNDDGESFKYIESALWFKTYMVTAIYIDCDKRDVLWYRNDIDPLHLQVDQLLKLRPPNGQRLFDDLDIYDYDPIVDELTDRAIVVMDQITHKTISKSEFTIEIVKIIHCYILPSLCFSSLDIEKLVKAVERVETLLHITEGEIIKKGKVVDLSITNLDKQRHRLLKNENMHIESYIRCCNKHFLNFFLLHIEKEILNFDTHLIQQQQLINNLRDKKGDSDEKIKSEIQLLRSDRDKEHKNLENLQTVRENIKNVIVRDSKLKKHKKKTKIRQNVFHDIYRELSIRLQEQKEEFHKLVIKKLKMTAVREAIKNSLIELRRERHGSNFMKPRTSFTDGSEYSIDMHSFMQRPESWMTIDDKVKKALATHGSEISRAHTDAVSMMIEKADAALSEMVQFGFRIEFSDDLSGKPRFSTSSQNSFKRSPSLNSRKIDDVSFGICENEVDAQFIQSMGESSRNQRRCVRTLSELVTEEFSDLSTSSLKRSMNDIGQDFRNHIDKMCGLFLDFIPEMEQRHSNKLWISYESILCEHVIDKLSELYIGVYRGPCHTLYTSLIKLSLSQFIVDDQFFQMLMHQSFEDLGELDDSPTSSIEIKLGRSDSNVDMNSLTSSESTGSLEISKCTLEQLYSIADEECEHVPLEIPNNLDLMSIPQSAGLNSVPSFLENTSVQQTASSTNSTSSKSVEQCYKEALDKLLSPATEYIRDAITVKPMLEKLRCLTKAFRFMNDQLVKINHGKNNACCDDMLTITTALILDLDCDLFTKLYATVNLLIDLKAPFLSNGVHDYCLTNFFGAYQYLFDKQVLERREVSGAIC